MSSTRSQNGCHTCRLRKKKCDELRPVCANCLSRAIPCYGYGAKPHWMDGAGLEAEEVKRIKKAAERNYRARRRGLRPGFMDGGMGGQGMGMEGICEELGGDKTLDENVNELGAGQVMRWEEELDLEPRYSSDLSMSSADGTSLSLRPKVLKDEAFSFEKMFPSYAQAEPEPQSEPHQRSRFSTGFASQAPFSTFSASQAITTRRSPSPRTLNSLWYQSDFGTTYDVRNNAELGLLMHYLDNVFCLQFGFSCLKRSSLAPDRGRGWYLDTLLRCKPLYFATLSISAQHQHLMKGGNVAAAWAPASAGKGSGAPSGKRIVGSGKGELGKVGLNWDAERNFVMTLKGLQGVIDELQGQGLEGLELLRARWQVLGTMCQVISLEVFRTFGGNWPIHIRAARTFLSMIGSSSFSSSTSLSPSASSKSPKEAPERPPRLDILEQILKDDKHQILSRNNTAALKHFVTTFIWVDILSRASGLPPSPSASPTPQTQAEPFDYLPLLEDATLDLSLVMGCENWVFVGLAQIITLEHALRARRSRRLPGAAPLLTSAASDDPYALDLHAQATVLEARFECGLRGLLDARAEMAGAGATELERHSSLVTELFALAAVTYLRVAVSGAWQFLPALRANVARSLAALVALPEALLIRVSWPFAVTGCMVLEEGREALRGVASGALRRGHNIGTVWKGCVVVEECWRLRDCEGGEVSWVDAMESLGEMVLLC